MAVWTTKYDTELSGSRILAPERYDPRRSLSPSGLLAGGVPLGTVALSLRKVISSATPGPGFCLVLDTSDAKEGVIVSPKAAIPTSALGSAKKRIETGNVIISRLRPYLRQVAYVDGHIRGLDSGSTLVCSTEFFVLQSLDERSIAFLVPFLLSHPVQQILAASQEGGHHPRFNEAALLGLSVPEELLRRREELSRSVEASVAQYRQSERAMAAMVEEVNDLLGTGGLPESGKQ